MTGHAGVRILMDASRETCPTLTLPVLPNMAHDREGFTVVKWEGDLREGFSGGEMIRILNVPTSYAASVARLGLGQYVTALGKRPKKPLELYEFENCPFCRKVREALCLLDLEVFIYPCPKGGTRFRPRAVELGGKQQFPYPNTGVGMFESADIVAYLQKTYGAPGE